MTYIVTYLSSPTPHMSKLYDLQKARRTQSQMETKTLEITSCQPLIDFKINFQLDSKKTQHISRNRFHLKQTLSCWAPPQCGTYFRPKQVNKVRKQDIRTHTQYKLHLPIRIRSLPAWLNDSDNTILWELNNIYVTLIRYETSSPFLFKDTWELQKIINSRFYLNHWCDKIRISVWSSHWWMSIAYWYLIIYDV